MVASLIVPRLTSWGLKLAAAAIASALTCYANAADQLTIEPYRATCAVNVPGSRGSGTLIKIDEITGAATILTCYHVAERTSMPAIVTWPWADGYVARGRVVKTLGGPGGSEKDLAIIIVDSAPPGVKPVTLKTFDSKDGYWVGAGYWRSKEQDELMMHITPPVTDLRDSGSNLLVGRKPYFGGMSGGPVFNRYGQQVGVIVTSDRDTYGEAVSSAAVIKLLRPYFP